MQYLCYFQQDNMQLLLFPQLFLGWGKELMITLSSKTGAAKSWFNCT